MQRRQHSDQAIVLRKLDDDFTGRRGFGGPAGQLAKAGVRLSRQDIVQCIATAGIIRDRDTDSPQGHAEAPSIDTHASTV
jgi:hypothetical protein